MLVRKTRRAATSLRESGVEGVNDIIRVARGGLVYECLLVWEKVGNVDCLEDLWFAGHKPKVG